jgi:hypothetical protein
VQSLCKEIENVRGGPATKPEHNVVVEFGLPGEPEQVPVCGAYWDVSESGLEVELEQERATSCGSDVADRAVNHVI